MFYEARPHNIKPFHTIAEAVSAVNGSKEKIHDFEAAHVVHQGKKVYLVSDNHIDDTPFGEVAVIIEKTDGFYQIESWTGRALTEQGLLRTLAEPPIMSKTTLILGTPSGNEKANFTCGCCGEWFKGNVKYQLTFDQDAGYGICPECEHYYR